MEETLQALLDIGWYNGYEDDIQKLTSYIEEHINKGDKRLEHIHIPFPEFLSEYDYDNYIRVFWSVLVMLYGNYGTSPRFGWLEIDPGNHIVDEIKEYIRE